MSTLIRKSFEQADEVRPFAEGKGRLEVVDLDNHTVGRAVFEVGWRWSEHVKPLAGTDSCEADHAGYVLSGRMCIRMNDGTELEFGPGDVMLCPPGHDAWVVGDEPAVVIDWAGFSDYAKPAADRQHAPA